ncbi:hypothetical protein BHM03_00059957 [Ensete ventricosum]|nr:hypothetical protein BHM03_00059957 [Ensete ventricosum]
MHPLKFPNSGIRAKIFVRKIGFKLHVMRLNRVELFYALVAAINSESRHCLRGRGGHMHDVCMQRWLATAKPPAGASTMAWLPARSGQLQPRPPCKRATARRGSSPQGAATREHGRLRPARRGDRLRPTHRGLSPTDSMHVADYKGLPPADSPTASRGWRRPQRWPPLGRVAAGRKGQPPPAQGQRRRRDMVCFVESLEGISLNQTHIITIMMT